MFKKKTKSEEQRGKAKLKESKPLPQAQPKTEEEIVQEVEKYKDVEGLSTKKLNIGLWLVEHRQMFIKLLDVFLVFVGVFTWSYTIYGFGYYLIKGMKDDKILAQQLTQTNIISHDYLVQIGAKDLVYSPVNILTSSGGKYDLAVRAENLNDRWYAEFDYYFLVGAEEMGRNHSFILPAEDKYLMALGQEMNSQPAMAQLVIENFSWMRINLHQIPDWQDFRDKHLDIVVEDINYIPAGSSKPSDKTSLNQVSFTTINNTAYNYWQVNFQIILLVGSNAVSINNVNLDQFMSGEERQVETRWPGRIGRVTTVEVKPELDITKEDIYIKY